MFLHYFRFFWVHVLALGVIDLKACGAFKAGRASSRIISFGGTSFNQQNCRNTRYCRRSAFRFQPLLLLQRRVHTDEEEDNESSAPLLDTTERVVICSEDPLVFTVPNLLSAQECRHVQDYVTSLEKKEEGRRTMTISNPPEISLSVSKLWPLPFLAFAAGLPPVWRLLFDEQGGGTVVGLDQILQAALPNVAVAFVASFALAYGVVLPLLRKTSETSSRTSVALALNQPSDFDTIRPLVDRIVAVTNHPWSHWEAPVVTRYDPGAIFARHGDASPTRGSEWNDLGGQRVVTCICYLNSLLQEQEEGGETYFDVLGLRVSPDEGKALVFYPANAETWVADDRTTHESLPPTREKWILQMFGRAERVPPPLGLPDSYGEE